MTPVECRNVRVHNKVLFSISKFFSRIILRKLDGEPGLKFREIERQLKNLIKLNADIDFIISNYKKYFVQLIQISNVWP